MIASGNGHHIAVADCVCLVEPVPVDPLNAKALRWIHPEVVHLFQVGLLRRIVGIVLVWWIARPAPRGVIGLAHHNPLPVHVPRHGDIMDCPLEGARPDSAHPHLLGWDQGGLAALVRPG